MPNIAQPNDKQFFFSLKYLLSEDALYWILTDPTAYWTRNVIPGLIFQEFVCINKGLLASDVTVNNVIFAPVDHKCNTAYISFNIVNIYNYLSI